LDVWLADADGSNQVRLTNGPGHRQCGVWSPDGRSVTFESQGDDGRLDIWRINVDGSALRQVTSHPADEFTPSWSRDGRTLYFTSNRTGRNEVWRVPRGGGSEEQVTDEGGCGPFESPDGRTLYFRRACSRSQPILARPTAGGEERTVLPCASRLAPDPRGGILYLECPREGAVPSRHQLRRFDEATGEDQPVATIEGDFISGFSVSADGQTILYGLSSWGTSDLLMIENFR
jgi:dipeptidyl aminopeptidase/acylaminoacyl peptidase